jgi:hypothetical protein
VALINQVAVAASLRTVSYTIARYCYCESLIGLYSATLSNTTRKYTMEIHSGNIPRKYTPEIHPGNTPRKYTPEIHPGNTPRKYTPEKICYLQSGHNCSRGGGDTLHTLANQHSAYRLELILKDMMS